MLEHPGTVREVDRQLEELLADPAYAKIVAMLADELRRRWRMETKRARRTVLSAIGEPAVLASIYVAATAARDAGKYPSLAAVISRRRVLDLLREDVRRKAHRSFPAASEEIEKDPGLRTLSTSGDDAPDVQLWRSRQSQWVTRAMASFAEQSPNNARQAALLRRRLFDETAYRDLAVELDCSENALRGRLCAAKKAFGKFIEDRYPELSPDLQDIIVPWER